jgi:O-antigen biosynthesis protein
LTGSLMWRMKRLQYLMQRVAGSIARRGLRGTAARISEEFRPRNSAPAPAWISEPQDLPFSPFTLPTSDTPRVSVIIPVHGKLAYTLSCLRSIARHGANATFEVIVVDDASPDESASTLTQINGLQLLRNSENLGFIGSCNAGAAMARGTHLLFLNNDTQVTPGWLDRLLDCFQDEPDCGIAGSRLLYPDGRLQEAGGIVFSNGDGWNYGRFESPQDPRFLYRRDVDYVSGASLMIETELFKQLGGFDDIYSPAYYEDTDLAFAVRAAGKRVIYQPESLVIHFEGISSGTDLQAGTKQYQRVNKTKFAEKWSSALKRQPAPGTPASIAVHHTNQPHILVVDALTPDASRDSGSLRMINMMQLMRELGWRVSFMADNRLASSEEITHLGRIGVHTLSNPWSPSLARWLARERNTLTAVMLSRHYIAAPNLDLVRRTVPHARVIFDTVDLHFLREQRAAEHTDNRALAGQAAASRKRELALIRACDITLVVSPVEQALLSHEAPEAKVELVSNVHEVFGRRAGFAERKDLVFVGGFGHPPNIDAVNWLTEDIYPRIRAARPDIALHLIGAIPEPARSKYQQPGIHVHGQVGDLAPWMDGCRIALAPLRFGAGVKGKVNMAMSYGLPVVATSIAAEGMQLHHGDNILVADDAETFSSTVLKLYDDEPLWLQLSDRGLDNICRYFSFDAAREALRRALPAPR